MGKQNVQAKEVYSAVASGSIFGQWSWIPLHRSAHQAARLSFPIRHIDLFSLYVLFSHFRPRDATRGNSLFQMSSYAPANVRITNEKTKGY